MSYVALAAILASTTPAVDPADVPVHRGPYVVKEWYGWQTMLFDAAAFTTVVIAATSRQDAEPLAWTALTLYAFGAPTVHWAHGNVGRGFGSLGMRVVGPLALAYGMCGFGSRSYCDDSALLGVLVGLTTAITVDAAALSWEDVTVVPRVMPTASITKDRATFGLAASF